MKTLPKDQLHRVNPKFRAMVQKAWDNGEEVPYSVTLLSDLPLTQKEIERGIEIEKAWTDDNQPHQKGES